MCSESFDYLGISELTQRKKTMDDLNSKEDLNTTEESAKILKEQYYLNNKII